MSLSHRAFNALIPFISIKVCILQHVFRIFIVYFYKVFYRYYFVSRRNTDRPTTTQSIIHVVMFKDLLCITLETVLYMRYLTSRTCSRSIFFRARDPCKYTHTRGAQTHVLLTENHNYPFVSSTSIKVDVTGDTKNNNLKGFLARKKKVEGFVEYLFCNETLVLNF